jgi:hypothetical protein
MILTFAFFLFFFLFSRRLYTHLRAGTKRLIEEYISEVVRALQLVCVMESQPISSNGSTTSNCPRVTTADKLSFFNETRHAFGRSALLLSGGATLGLYHIGVCKALHDNSLLPRVLSGSSVGSIICAMVGTRTDEELTDLFSPESNAIKLNFFPPNGGSVKRKITRLFTQGVLMDIRILKRCVKANVPPLTFQEAYGKKKKESQYVVCISFCVFAVDTHYCIYLFVFVLLSRTIWSYNQYSRFPCFWCR